jgi:heme oxygenase
MSKWVDGFQRDASTGPMNSDIDKLSLSAAFRQRTATLHTHAERSGIVQDLLVGRITRNGYALLIRNLLPAYEALEAGLRDRHTAPGFRRLADPAVYRSTAIRADLSALCGLGWSDALPLLGAGRHYAARIATLAAGEGLGLIAHAYARYLGDLNGGQILKRLLTKSLGLTPETLSFYDFPGIPDLDAFKGDYRAAIDEAALAIAAMEPVIEEAALAFELNIQVSEAVKSAVSRETAAVPGAAGIRVPAFGRA